MKKIISKICFMSIAALVSVCSLAFLAVNLRSFFAFDWLVFSDPIYGCFAGLSKIIMWAVGVAALPLTIVYVKKNTPTLRMTLMVYGLSIFIAGAAMALILKTDGGVIPLYYIIPVSLIPTLFVLTEYFYDSNNK